MASQVVAEYKSSRPNRDTYKVSIDDQGRCWCGCWQWKINKTCKHTEDYQINRASANINTPEVPKSINPIQQAINEEVESQCNIKPSKVSKPINPIQQAINEAVATMKGNQ